MPVGSNLATPAAVATSPKRFLRACVAGLALVSCAALADPHGAPIPEQYSESACRTLVRDAGRMIAWARWELRVSQDNARKAPVRPGTPDWVSVLLKDWITDAYQWKATDEQVFQWAAELGNTENLPSAQALTVHETIAIWLRRIARGCHREEA